MCIWTRAGTYFGPYRAVLSSIVQTASFIIRSHRSKDLVTSVQALKEQELWAFWYRVIAHAIKYAKPRNSEKTLPKPVTSYSRTKNSARLGRIRLASTSGNFGYIRGPNQLSSPGFGTTTHGSQWRHHSPSYFQASSIRSLTHGHTTTADPNNNGFHTSSAAN